MPTIDLSDEELQGLIMICANGSGPGISWMLTNAILTKAQSASQSAHAKAQEIFPPGADGLDHEPIASPPSLAKAGARSR